MQAKYPLINRKFCAILEKTRKGTQTMDIRFDEYNAYPDSDIIAVTDEGITLSNGQLLDFAGCAANFRAVHGGSGRCVGERDVTGSSPSIVFYTAPVTTHIVFVSGGKLREFFGRNAADRFHALCRQIEGFGYTTRDLS